MADERDTKRQDVERMINAFGSDTARWPRDRRVDAGDCLEAPDIADRLAAERAFEGLLSKAETAAPSDGFTARVMAAALDARTVASGASGDLEPAGGERGLIANASLASSAGHGARGSVASTAAGRGWVLNSIAAFTCAVCFASGIYAGADVLPQATFEVAAESLGFVAASDGETFALLSGSDDWITGDSL